MPLAGIGPAVPPAGRLSPNASGSSYEDGSGELAMTPAPPHNTPARIRTGRLPTNQKTGCAQCTGSTDKNLRGGSKKVFRFGEPGLDKPSPPNTPSRIRTGRLSRETGDVPTLNGKYKTSMEWIGKLSFPNRNFFFEKFFKKFWPSKELWGEPGIYRSQSADSVFVEKKNISPIGTSFGSWKHSPGLPHPSAPS